MHMPAAASKPSSFLRQMMARTSSVVTSPTRLLPMAGTMDLSK